MQVDDSVRVFFLYLRIGEGIHVVYIIFALCGNGFYMTNSPPLSATLNRFSAGHPVNLKRTCTCSVILQMRQYTAMTQRVTSPSSQTMKKTCTLCQIHCRTHLYSVLFDRADMKTRNTAYRYYTDCCIAISFCLSNFNTCQLFCIFC